MKLLVGLGNEGAEYTNTRHNVGFLVLDSFSKKRNIKFKKTGDYSFARLNSLILIKPSTFMNSSGLALNSALCRFKPSSFLVISDDVNLNFGQIRMRKNGSSGGHKGLKSIEGVLGSQSYNRIRVGIGGGNLPHLSSFVLGKFAKREIDELTKVINYISELIEKYIEEGFDATIELFSRTKRPILS